MIGTLTSSGTFLPFSRQLPNKKLLRAISRFVSFRFAGLAYLVSIRIQESCGRFAPVPVRRDSRQPIRFISASFLNLCFALALRARLTMITAHARLPRFSRPVHGKCFVTTLRARLTMVRAPARLLRYTTVRTPDHGKRARPTAALQHCTPA